MMVMTMECTEGHFDTVRGLSLARLKICTETMEEFTG